MPLKLTYLQLENHLQKNLANCYVLASNEAYLLQDAVGLIREAAKKHQITSRLSLTKDDDVSGEQLFNALQATSLFNEKQLIEFDLREHTPNKTLASHLEHYFNKPNIDHIFVLKISKIDPKISKATWFKACEANAVVVNIWPIYREGLPQWILQKSKKLGLSLTREAIIYLIEYCEGNLSAMAQMLEKLLLLQTAEAISEQMLATIIHDESRFTIFDLGETIVAQDPSRTLHVLENLKYASIEPAIILWSITRELRILLEIALQRSAGVTYPAIFQKMHIFPRRQAAIQHYLKNYSANTLMLALADAAKLDQMLKGMIPGNIWDTLQLFCLRLSDKTYI